MVVELHKEEVYGEELVIVWCGDWRNFRIVQVQE